ncbi:carbon storage regulator CsrA [Desulfofalx alkaliphila]|uniref:carbon storage regulator CsrA n=1 Tax=Desulfofalx alkaliphila TaxID=105483 RepID=UPI0004E171C6|nr:carbon storage regulator CsrA [Desulfofalx alkaliphila]
MLILSRKKGESIHIGNNIKVVVVDVQNDQVRLGIEAPADVDIYRSEIYHSIQKENLKALVNQNIFKKK